MEISRNRFFGKLGQARGPNKIILFGGFRSAKGRKPKCREAQGCARAASTHPTFLFLGHLYKL